MTKHTPEPWRIERHGDTTSVVGPGGILIASDEDYYPPPLDPINACRIVACVNALAGYPDPSALPDLIAALVLLDNITSDDFSKGADRPIRDALARLTGKAGE